MPRCISALLLSCAFVSAANHQSRAAVVTIPPGLHPGDQYRLAFVTTATTNARSSDVNYYNSIATTAANSNASLAALGTTWAAIASIGKASAPVSAIKNTGTDPVRIGVPIFNLAGEMTASNYQDLWGANNNPGTSPSIDVTETGSIYHGLVWSGTTSTGTVAGAGGSALGNVTVLPIDHKANVGISSIGPSSSSSWISTVQSILDYKPLDNVYPIYAISGVITVVPEANTMVLLGSGMIAAFSFLVFRRIKASM